MLLTLPRLIAAGTLALMLVACASTSGGVTSVTIDGGDQSTVVGSALTLSVTVATTGNASDAVSWASSNETVATIDSAGSVTSLEVGTTDITATSTVDPSKTDTITLS
ncbi:MAG: Ig-like domain-containing protein, partial [Thioalkalivibrio sp.]|nr:Ig-like domain-containing protein [Thioalkalivibrio sp.]